MKQFKTVFEFELLSYLKSKPYRISTAVMACLALLLGMLPLILSGFSFFSGDSGDAKNMEANAPIGVYDAKASPPEYLA